MLEYSCILFDIFTVEFNTNEIFEYLEFLLRPCLIDRLIRSNSSSPFDPEQSMDVIWSVELLKITVKAC